MPRWAIDITAGTGGFEAATKRIPAATKKATDKATRYHKSAAKKSADAWATSFKTSALVAGGLIAAGATAFLKLTHSVIDYRNELNDAAARTGLAADTLQALRLSAESSGQEFSTLLKATERIPKLMGDADRGTKTVVNAFAALGVETHDATGNLRASDSVTRDLIKSLGSITDPTEKAVKGMALFGRAGGSVTQALGAGAKIFEQYDRIAKRYGVETGPEASAAAARMQEEFARLGLVSRGAGDDIWQAFGGDDGALGGIKAMASGIVFASDLLVQLRESFELPGWETFLGPVALIKQARNIGHVADAWEHAAEKAQKYLIIADETDRVAAAGSSAMAAYNAELERNAKAGKKAADPAKQLAKELATISGIQWQATEDLASAEAKLTRAYIEQTEPLMEIIELHNAEGEVAEKAMLALEAADERLTRDKQAEAEKRIEAAREETDKRIAEAEREADARLALERRVTDGKLQLASLASDTMIEYSRLMVDGEGKATAEGKVLAKAGAATDIITSTAAGIMGSWEAYAGIPFVGPALAAAQSALIGGLGMAQLAQVASAYGGLDLGYSASTGTVTPVVTHPGERARIETRSEVERSKRGAGGPTMVETWINGRSIATTVAEQIRSGGALTAELTRRTGRLGHTPAFRSA